ncbi:MAG: nitroreductase family protein [Leptospirales bacterium]
MLPDITKIIKQRKSYRNFNSQPLTNSVIAKLQNFANHLPEGPFGNKCKFYFVQTDLDIRNFYKQGTYGFIHGARNWIVSSTSESGKMNFEDLGYLMELIVLYATSLDIQTCWVGGSFRKRYFHNKVNNNTGDIIPAIAAIGVAEPYEGTLNAIIKWSVQSKKRKPWKSLFFLDNMDRPLTESEAGQYAIPLEMLRMAPSSSNIQPWRIIKEMNRDVFHFFLLRKKRIKEFHKFFNIYDIQRIDMGIAMCHFTEAAKEQGNHGSWQFALPQFLFPKNLDHVATWYGRSA